MTKSCLIIGTGDETGVAIARAFAKEGLTVCVSRRLFHAEELEELAASIRRDGGKAFAFPANVQDEEAVLALFKHIEAEIGPLEVVVFNLGANVKLSITETSARVYRNVWEMSAFAGFLTGREAARHMLPRERGTIIFTGGAASLRGGAGYSAYAGAKHALRALAQSMARDLGPKNIHVAHTVIGGEIESNYAHERGSSVTGSFENDSNLNPDHIARAYVNLYKQPRQGWTHELDLRPYSEK